MSKEEKAKRALELYHATPNGQIVDADTILADAVAEASFEETGLGEEAIQIWQKSTDKASVEQMFYNLTDVEFETFLDRCIEKTTRPE